MLEEERAFLLRSLDDLDAEVAAGELEAADAESLRSDYTHRLAEVQRAIEAGADVEPVPEPEVRRERRWGRRAIGVGLVLAILAGSGVGIAAFTGERRPGETITGETPSTTNGLLDQAAELVQEGEILEAVQTYDRVLERQPDNVEALAERGFLLLRVAQSACGNDALVERGRQSIEQALAVAPGDPRLLFYLGAARFLSGDRPGAEAAFDQALASNAPADVREAIATFRADATTTSTAAP